MAAQYPDAETRRRTVLVVVLNNAEDLLRAADQGWYRIPQRHAPKRMGADYLAFYQTGAFRTEGEAHTVTYYAPTRRYKLLTRRELLPDEPDHPRAADYYYRVEIGPLARLAHPVPAQRLRRVTFIHTTMDRLLTAGDVTDLFQQDDPFDTLWGALREHNLRPLRNRLLHERPVDIALRARGGYLAIQCVEGSTVSEHGALLLPDRWELLQLPPSRIQDDLAGCLREVGAALIGLGGSNLNLGT
ncbi:MAG: hypothetical protein IPK16_02480 [Anaerolineales bacterium]|nr:hypothetical protein [Anaerolineales bacterium]